MSEKTVFILYDGERVKVKCTNFESLKQKIKTKIDLSADFNLRYYADDENYNTIFDNEDFEDVPTDAKLKLVIKSKESTNIFFFC